MNSLLWLLGVCIHYNLYYEYNSIHYHGQSPPTYSPDKSMLFIESDRELIRAIQGNSDDRCLC